jgi:hypothetical protein
VLLLAARVVTEVLEELEDLPTEEGWLGLPTHWLLLVLLMQQGTLLFWQVMVATQVREAPEQRAAPGKWAAQVVQAVRLVLEERHTQEG